MGWVLEPDANDASGIVATVDASKARVAAMKPQWVLEPEAPQGTALSRGYQAVRDFATKAINLTDVTPEARKAAGQPPPGEQYNPLPKDLTSGLAQTALGVTSKFLPTTPATVGQAAARTGAVTAGAATGAALEDKDPLTEGAKAGGLTALIEAAVPGFGKLARSTEWGRRTIAADDARRVGNAASAAAPTLQPGTTAPAMQRTAEGQGLARIGDAKENVVADIEARLNAVPKETPHFTDALGKQWVRVPGGGWQAARQAGQIPMPSLGEPSMSLRDANAKLSEIGDMMRGVKPLDPRFPKDVDLKQKYAEVAEGIRQGIEKVAGPETAQQWARGQADYRAGRFLSDDVLGRTGLFKQGEFNVTDLQRWLKNPDNRANLARATGGDLAKGTNLDAYNRIVNSITRGAEPGMVDRMAGQAPGLLSGRGSYGMWRAPAELVRTLFPNASSRYVGQTPFTLPPQLQAILDQGGQRALSGVSR